MRRQALVLCGAAACVWNPGWYTAAVASGLSVLALESSRGPYVQLPFLDGWRRTGRLRLIEPTDRAGLDQALREWQEQFDIVSVAPLTEAWIAAGNGVSQSAGLSGLGVRAVEISRDKRKQRQAFPKLSPHWTATTYGGLRALEWSNYPAVVKPVGSSGSTGVRRVESLEELARAGEGQPPDRPVVVEEFLSGEEYSVEVIVAGHQPQWAIVTQKTTGEDLGRPGDFVEVKHTVRNDLSGAALRELTNGAYAVVDGLGAADGALHIEFRLSSEGCRLIEVNGRPGGGNIPALVSLATGRSFEAFALGLGVIGGNGSGSPRRCARQGYLNHPAGTLENVSVDWPGVTPAWIVEGDSVEFDEVALPDDPARLRALVVVQGRHACLGPPRDNGERAVTYVIDAPTIVELERIDGAVAARTTISVGPMDARPVAH
jgi:predicted ATP-grasp superfamily ATP-dependent carboligase